MDFTQIARQIKSVIENNNGCTIKTTPKKGAGFVPYNRFNIKWGQVDVCPKRVRVVLDIYPSRYTIIELEKDLSLPAKNKGDGKTGMFIKPTEKDVPHFDALEISLYQDYCESFNLQQFEKLLDFIGKVAAESSFKSRSTSR
jgi:hypothetical protein